MTYVMVIDDDEQIRELLRETLERDGYEVVTAANGDEGIRLHRRKSADVVITDILMPVKGGISTIHELRREFPDVKIIAITGGGYYGPQSHYLGMASQIGAQRVIAKPFIRRQILEAVSELAKGYRPRAEAFSPTA
jgi:CheY-like chemotaxis protein